MARGVKWRPPIYRSELPRDLYIQRNYDLHELNVLRNMGAMHIQYGNVQAAMTNIELAIATNKRVARWQALIDRYEAAGYRLTPEQEPYYAR